MVGVGVERCGHHSHNSDTWCLSLFDLCLCCHMCSPLCFSSIFLWRQSAHVKCAIYCAFSCIAIEVDIWPSYTYTPYYMCLLFFVHDLLYVCTPYNDILRLR